MSFYQTVQLKFWRKSQYPISGVSERLATKGPAIDYAYGTALYPDGSAVWWRHTELREYDFDKKPIGFCSSPNWIRFADGSFEYVGSPGIYWIKDYANRHAAVDIAKFTRSLAIEFPNKEWRLWDEAIENPDVRNRLAEDALSGAHQVLPIDDHYCALLPADTVSRSGYWAVEDLIKDRTNLRNANAESVHTTSAFPLPFPERPDIPCRLVILSTDPTALERYPSWIESLDEDDPKEIVEFRIGAGSRGRAVPIHDMAKQGWDNRWSIRQKPYG